MRLLLINLTNWYAWSTLLSTIVCVWSTRSFSYPIQLNCKLSILILNIVVSEAPVTIAMTSQLCNRLISNCLVKMDG